MEPDASFAEEEEEEEEEDLAEFEEDDHRLVRLGFVDSSYSVVGSGGISADSSTMVLQVLNRQLSWTRNLNLKARLNELVLWPSLNNSGSNSNNCYSVLIFTLVGIALLFGAVSSLHKLGILESPQDFYFKSHSLSSHEIPVSESPALKLDPPTTTTTFAPSNNSSLRDFPNGPKSSPFESSIAAAPSGSTEPSNNSSEQLVSGSLDLAPSPTIALDKSSEFEDSNHSKSSKTPSLQFSVPGTATLNCSEDKTFAASISRPNLDDHVFQTMSATYNFMSDDDLLWIATRTSSRSRGSRPKHTPKIAFMFLVRGSLPFAPLWQRYFRNHEDKFSIYVHAAPSYIPNDVPVSSPFYGRFIRSKEVKWGQISMTDAERRLLGNALLDYTNDWFVLLSEACIPLDNFPNTYNYITNSRASFVQSYLDSVEEGKGRLSRRAARKMAPEITWQNFRKGSQWFQINRELAMLLAADTKLYDKFAASMCSRSSKKRKSVCYIDEHYISTVAALWLPDQLAYRTLTNFHFRGTAAHPQQWDKSRVNKSLIHWLRDGHNCTYESESSMQSTSQATVKTTTTTSVCFFFARKFDPDALEPLLEMATELMGIPP